MKFVKSQCNSEYNRIDCAHLDSPMFDCAGPVDRAVSLESDGHQWPGKRCCATSVEPTWKETTALKHAEPRSVEFRVLVTPQRILMSRARTNCNCQGLLQLTAWPISRLQAIPEMYKRACGARGPPVVVEPVRCPMDGKGRLLHCTNRENYWPVISNSCRNKHSI
jgi:hypothetical protein